MKLKKYSKLIFIIMFLFILFSINYSTTYAASLENIISGSDNFLETGSNAGSPINYTNLKDIADNIYNILLILGIAIAMIIGVVLGIQFITGSVEQKSKIKESLIPYIVGCIIVFGAFGIWKLVVTLLGAIE